jgi:hypothetical protein
MSGQRQKNQPEQGVLAFPVESRSDAPKAAERGIETLVAKRKSESLAGTERSGNGHAEPVASAYSRWSRRLRLTCGDGSDTWVTVKRPRCCKALKRGYATDSGLWCGSNGSVDERGSASSANGVSARTWRLKWPVALMAPGGSRTRPPCTLLCLMPTSMGSGFLRWLHGLSSTRRTAGCGPACPGGVAGCVKKTRKRHAIRKMKVGPSKSSCRRGLQTAGSCFSQKLRWCCVMKTQRRRAVRKMKVGPSESPCRRRLQTAISCYEPKLVGGERYG